MSTVDWIRLRGSNPYPDGAARQAVVVKTVGTKWHGVVCHAVERPERDTVVDATDVVSVGLNVGQVTTSNEIILH